MHDFKVGGGAQYHLQSTVWRIHPEPVQVHHAGGQMFQNTVCAKCTCLYVNFQNKYN